MTKSRGGNTPVAAAVEVFVQIEIWSDVACPWCYIGKRRLESALEAFEHADEVDIRYRSYQLNPGAPTEPTESLASMLGRKYGGGEDAGRQMIDRVEATAAEDGLIMHHHSTIPANTRDAHRLLQYATTEGKQGALKERLLSAYFVDSVNVAHAATLREAAADVGLDAQRVDEVLASNEFDAAVDADIREGASLGVNGVPFYVIDRKYGISGAQSAETFTQVLERAWAEARPVLDLVRGGHSEEACGPDGCAI
jgi:predicted DsbA family dithiol-disulfide isomerase